MRKVLRKNQRSLKNKKIMKVTKLAGGCLLIVGIIIISYSLFTSYKIFNGKSSAPIIFEAKEEENKVAPPQQKTQDLKSQQDRLLEEKMQEQLQEQLKGMMPAGYFPKLLNLIAWSIFAGILIFGGTQISQIGIKLINHSTK